MITFAEEFADGRITEKELNNARSLACQAAQNVIVRETRTRGGPPDRLLGTRLTFAADAALANHHLAYQMTVTCPRSVFQEDGTLKEVIPTILRDIFGNPLRPAAPDPAWLTSTVIALATGVYEERAFDRMPILADALQDAGCDNADILDHCRGSGPHCRGCWVIDLLTGRK